MLSCCEPVSSTCVLAKIPCWDKHKIDITIPKGKNKKEERGNSSHISPKASGEIPLDLKTRMILFDLMLCLPSPLMWRSHLLNTLGQESQLPDPLEQYSCPHSFNKQELGPQSLGQPALMALGDPALAATLCLLVTPLVFSPKHAFSFL